MPALQRNIGVRGPRFFKEGDGVMFVHHFDASTREGPRPATPEDSAAHPEAWSAFQAERETYPFQPIIQTVDPPEGRPAPEEGPYAKRRKEAAA